ncbi:MAG: hypothetical protein NPIRA04_27120 [Nitrospirales bacterium]|nr:MAG: hypothetical protein NPIRA04_27120 [Nitrospirales bacterium]
MKHNLPASPAVGDLLSLGTKDKQLAEGIDAIEIEPNGSEELYILLHCGIRESVYRGTHLMDMFSKKVQGGTEQAPLFMLYRHVLDIGDSIGTLLRFGSTSSTSILLRSLFESYLSLHFLLEGNVLNKDRSLAYWAHYKIKQLETFTKYDSFAKEGKQFHKILDDDPLANNVDFPKHDYAHERKEIEKILNLDKFRQFYDQYKSRKKGKRPRHWYSLCSTAIDIRSLAKLLKREAEYSLLYSRLSELAHSTDVISEKLTLSKEGATLIHPLRGPYKSLKLVSSFTSSYLLGCHHALVESYFLKDEEVRAGFKNWYFKYRHFHLWLTGNQPKP